MATEPKSEATDEGVVMMGEWSQKGNRSKRLTMCGCFLFIVVSTVQLVALFQIGDSVTALRIKVDPEFAAARQPEADSWALGSSSVSGGGKKGFTPVSQRKPSLRTDALTKANTQLKDENQQLKVSLAQVQEAFDKQQQQLAQMKVQGSESLLLQEKDARIRALEDELDRVKMQQADALGTKVAPYITLPKGTTGVKINVGANYRPLVECNPFDTIVCFLFDIQNDPVQYLRGQYKDNANTYIFTLGISDFEGLAAFPTLGYGGEAQSTSLSEAKNKDAGWNNGANRGAMDWSGVITMAQLIDSIDPEIPILMLATDMQGHDFTAIVSAGERLKRVQALQVELYKGIATYAGVKNDYDDDWLPYMAKMGFVEEMCAPGYVVPGEANEWDCIWKPAA